MSTPVPPGPGQPGGLPPGLAPGGGSAPAGGWIPVGAGTPPVVPTSPPPARRRGRPAFTVLGVLLILGGIGAAIGIAVAGNQRLADGVEQLARGPANCVTTLDVAKDSTYYFYVESRGEVADVRGDCPAIGDSFDVGDDTGDARLSLQDDDRQSVRLRRAGGVTYDSGGFRGELVRTAELAEGRYQLAVEADDDVVVAVGRDVDGLKPGLAVPIIVGVAGLVLGIAALVLGRRRGAAPTPPAPSGPNAAPFGGLGVPGQPVGQQPPGWAAPPPPRA